MFEILKSIARHFVVYGLANIANRIIGFILIPLYTYYLTTSDYGTLELLELTTYIVGMFLAMGISSSVLRFYYDSDNPDERRGVVGTAFLGIWGISLLGAVCLIIFSSDISSLVFKTRDNTGLFRLIFLSLMFGLANEVPLAAIRAQQKSLLYSIISLSRLLSSLVLNIVFLVAFGWGIRGIVLSSVITQMLAGIFLAFYTIKWIGVSFSSKKFVELAKYGFPLILGGIGMFVMNFADRFFLQRFTTLSDVGIYSLGYKFGMVINPLVVTPYESIWRPKMFELAKRQDAKEIYSLMFTYFLYIQILFGLAVSVLISDVIQIVTKPEFHRAAILVPPILLSYIFNGAKIHIQTSIFMQKKTKYIAYIVALSALSSLILNYLLIPRFGIWGAVWATVSSFGIMLILNLIVSNRIYYVRYEYVRLTKLTVLGFAFYIVSLGIHMETVALSILLKIVIILSFPFVLFLLGFYTSREIKKIKELSRNTATLIQLRLTGRNGPKK